VRLEVQLPVTVAATLMARRAIDRALASIHVDGEASSNIRLGVSELVSNVLRHGALLTGDRFVLTASDPEGLVRVEVEQASSAAEVHMVERSRMDASGGFGLRLVDEMTDRWGYQQGPPGMVWFEVAR
jgi:anti-sigma regulatory factor (Ser/Thr protein kinase)